MSTVARSGVGGVDDRAGVPQRGVQAGAGVRVDPGLAADRHGLMASAFEYVDGELPDPAGRAGHCDPHRASLLVSTMSFPARGRHKKRADTKG